MNALSGLLKHFNFQIFLLVSLFLVMPLVYVEELQDTILHPRFIFLSLILVISATYFFFKKKSFRFVASQPLTFLFLGFVIVNALSFNIAINKAECVFEIAKLLLAFFAFVFLVQVFEGWNNGFLILAKCIVLSITVHGLITVSEFFIDGIDLSSYKSLCEFTGLMGNKNILCEYMLCCLPFCIYCFGISGRIWKALSLSAIFLTVIAFVFLQTRSVWVATSLVSVFVFILLCIIRKKGLGLKLVEKREKKPLLFLPIIAALLILFTTQPSVRSSIIERIKSVTQLSKNGSAKGRLVLWEKSIRLFHEHPLQGIGAGNWKISFQKYGQEYPSNVFNVRAMNDFMLVLCETGIPGLLLFIGLFLYTNFVLIKILFRTNDIRIRGLTLTILSALLFYTITSFFSFPKERPDNLILLSVLLAITVSLNNSKNKNIGNFNLKDALLLIFTFAFLICISFVLIKRAEGEYFLQKALRLRTLNDHKGVIETISKAENYFYTVDANVTPLAWYKGVARFQLNDSLALTDLEKAYTHNPYHLHVLNNLATALEHARQSEEAIRYYKEAVFISPRFLPAIMNLSIVYYNQGNFTEATNTINLWKARKLTVVNNLKKIINAKEKQQGTKK